MLKQNWAMTLVLDLEFSIGDWLVEKGGTFPSTVGEIYKILVKWDIFQAPPILKRGMTFSKLAKRGDSIFLIRGGIEKSGGM